MNSRERRTARYRAKCAAEGRLEKNIAIALTGCTSRVCKATMPVPVRSTERPSADNICFPDVAIFNAGYRKSAEAVTAR